MNLLLVVVFFITGAITADLYALILWQSVKSLRDAQHPVLLVAGGFTGRLALCAGIFVLAAYGGHFERLAACAAGFIIMRTIAINAVKNAKARAADEH